MVAMLPLIPIYSSCMMSMYDTYWHSRKKLQHLELQLVEIPTSTCWFSSYQASTKPHHLCPQFMKMNANWNFQLQLQVELWKLTIIDTMMDACTFCTLHLHMPQAISESDSAHRSTVARARWHKGMAIVLARNVSCQHIANCCDTTVCRYSVA
jgi:hypothetical protein